MRRWEDLDPDVQEERGSCTMMLLIYFWIMVIMLLRNAQEGSSRVRIPSGRVEAGAECGVAAGATGAGHVARKSLRKKLGINFCNIHSFKLGFRHCFVR